MILRLAGFAPYDTTFQPAAGLWTAFNDVAIIPGGGRSGSADDNCAAFDTSLSSVLSLTVSPGAVAGLYTATYGLAVRILTVTDSGDPNNPNLTTLESIWTASSHFDLCLLDTGALRLRQTTSGGSVLGTICQTVANVVPIATGGMYLEVQVRLEAGVATACQIRASDPSGTVNPLVQGALVVADAGPYTTFRLGGGVAESPATWRVADVYLNDGVPAATPIPYKGQLIYNDSFFGNTHIEALYPTADGTNLEVDNVPWVPNLGSTQYTQVDEHPPDEDASFDYAEEADQTTTMAYQSPHSSAYGRIGCLGPAPIYGVQWDGRMRNSGVPLDVAPIIREIVGGTIPTDLIDQGPTQDVDTDDYLYYPVVYDRNPINGEPWSFGHFQTTIVGTLGTTEIGMRFL